MPNDPRNDLDIDSYSWWWDHPDERLVRVCRRLDRLRTGCTVGIVGGLLGTVVLAGANAGAPSFIAFGIAVTSGLVRYPLPGLIRALVDTINRIRRKELPERIAPGMVISVRAYKDRRMPENGNVLLGEVTDVADAETLNRPLEHSLYATPVVKTDHESQLPSSSHTLGTVTILSEPIWETEYLVSGQVKRGDQGYFFVEGEYALLAGKRQTSSGS